MLPAEFDVAVAELQSQQPNLNMPSVGTATSSHGGGPSGSATGHDAHVETELLENDDNLDGKAIKVAEEDPEDALDSIVLAAAAEATTPLHVSWFGLPFEPAVEDAYQAQLAVQRVWAILVIFLLRCMIMTLERCYPLDLGYLGGTYVFMGASVSKSNLCIQTGFVMIAGSGFFYFNNLRPVVNLTLTPTLTLNHRQVALCFMEHWGSLQSLQTFHLTTQDLPSMHR